MQNKMHRSSLYSLMSSDECKHLRNTPPTRYQHLYHLTYVLMEKPAQFDTAFGKKEGLKRCGLLHRRMDWPFTEVSNLPTPNPEHDKYFHYPPKEGRTTKSSPMDSHHLLSFTL